MTTEHGDRLVAEQHEILRVVAGSELTGTQVESGDHDFMGVFVEPKSRIYGTEPALDHFVFRTQDEGVRSGPGDTDLVSYSLRKYIRLAAKGNPSALLPLFAPEDKIIRATVVGHDLREMRNAFVSKEAISRFLGFMHNQRERMMGGGKRNRVPNRPELVDKYGYDTKYAGHAVRLALQGLEIAEFGHLTLPMAGWQADYVIDVRKGRHTRDDLNAWLSVAERDLQQWLVKSPLPDHPNWALINAFSVQAHEAHWAKGRRQ